MVITVPTIYREKENYLIQTINDSIEKDPKARGQIFEFFIGNRSEKSLEMNSLIGYSEFGFRNLWWKVKYLTNLEWSLIEDKTVNVRFNFNFMRCMTATSFTEDILYLEDDIEFTNNWLCKLQEIIKVLDVEYNNNYILTLYSPWKFNHSRLVDQIQPGHFYGTQAVYIKGKYQKGLFEKIYNDGFLNFRHQADLLLDEYAKENNIPILALTKSLVQHKGKESTGLGNYHWTENFQ